MKAISLLPKNNHRTMCGSINSIKLIAFKLMIEYWNVKRKIKVDRKLFFTE